MSIESPFGQRCYLHGTVILLLLLAGLSYMAISQGDESIYQENSLMENLQILLLSVASIGFGCAAIMNHGRHRIFAWFFSLLCFLFVFREFELENYDAPKVLIYLLAEDGRALSLLLLLGLLGMMVKELKHYFSHFKAYLFSKVGCSIFLAALILLVFAQTFDRKWVVVPYLSFFEELSEVAAYYFLMLGGLFATRDLLNLERDLKE